MLKNSKKIFTTYALFVSINSCQIACHGKEQPQKMGRQDQLRYLNQALNKSINIYGIVLDEENKGVFGAEIEIQLTKSSSVYLTSFVHTYKLKTNAKGEFSLTGESGEGFGVYNVKKSGFDYLRQQSVNTSFDLNDSSNFNSNRTLPDQQHPLILRMRKKGEVAFLMGDVEGGGFAFDIKDSGMRKAHDFILPERIEEMDLSKSRKPDGTLWMYDRYLHFPDLIAKATYDGKNGAWTLTLAPQGPGAGILVSERLLYEAPAEGYQASYTLRSDIFAKTYEDCFREPKPGEPYKPVKGLFIYTRSREPAVYTRIRINLFVADDRKIQMGGGGWTINPFGDRNLEPATELPSDISVQLRQNVREAYRHGVHPTKPDLARLVQEWEKSHPRPLPEKMKDWLKK